MADGIFYSSWSNNWKPSGSSENKQFRTWVYYSYEDSSIATSLTVTVKMGIQLSKKVTATFPTNTISGSATGSYGSHSTNFSSGVLWYEWGSTSFTINKTTSDQSAWISATATSSSNSWNQSLAASGYIPIPALSSFIISYDSQGGTPVDAQTKYYNVAITVQNAPTRTGYTPDAWYWNNVGSKVSPNTSWNGDNVTGTFYARWVANQYTIVYDKNATDATGTTETSTHTYDVSKNLTTNGYNRTDYLFKGWSNTTNGSVNYTNGQSIINLQTSGSKTIYAVWQYQYTEPDIKSLSAFRVDSTTLSEDDTGDGACLLCTVIPPIKEDANGNFTNVATTVQFQYLVNNTWTNIDSAQTITGFKLTTDTSIVANKIYYTRSTSGGTYIYTQVNNPIVANIGTYYDLLNPVYVNSLDTDTQYDVRAVITYVTDGSITKTKIRQSFISKAEFALDIDANGTSFGLFTVASGTYNDELNEPVKTISINGDLLLQLNDQVSADAHIDGLILEAIEQLGWDVEVNPSDTTS